MNIEDKDGYLWLGTANEGVIKTDGNVLTYITTADGLPSNRVHTLVENKDGNIWIGTQEGLASYTPNPIIPLTHIEFIVADKVYTEPKMFSLPAGVKNLRINYRGISFRTRPEAIQYFYQLQEHDVERALSSFGNWRGPTNERSVDYLDLKPGRYTFKVKAVDMDLNYSEPASVTFKVMPPFYMSAGFLVPTVSFGTILLAALTVLSIAFIKRRRQVRAYQQETVQELQDAREMQMSLLPETAPLIEGFDIAGKSIPAKTVGGDFFDYLSLTNGKIGIALADISGKGLKGAMNAVLTNGMLDEIAKVEVSCGKILSVLNAGLYPRMEKTMFTAFGFAILEQKSGKLQWATAAQPYPIVKRNGQVFEFKSEGGLPLGMMPRVEYVDSVLELQAGDIVIFYTDGIIEAENKSEEMYSTERLEKLITDINSTMNGEEIIDTILLDVADFVGDAEQYDDMTVVVLKKL